MLRLLTSDPAAHWSAQPASRPTPRNPARIPTARQTAEVDPSVCRCRSQPIPGATRMPYTIAVIPPISRTRPRRSRLHRQRRRRKARGHPPGAPLPSPPRVSPPPTGPALTAFHHPSRRDWAALPARWVPAPARRDRATFGLPRRGGRAERRTDLCTSPGSRPGADKVSRSRRLPFRFPKPSGSNRPRHTAGFAAGNLVAATGWSLPTPGRAER